MLLHSVPPACVLIFSSSLLLSGGRVLILDKSAFCGGNSTKATSGINGAGTRTQRANKAGQNK